MINQKSNKTKGKITIIPHANPYNKEIKGKGQVVTMKKKPIKK